MSFFDNLIVYTFLGLGIYIVLFYLGVYFENRKNLKSPKPKKFPKVSILLPAYNEGQVIESTIKSVLDLDYPKKEVIVINDGSTDDTYRKAKKFERFGVKVFTKKNEGTKASAVNFGLKKCTSEFIFVLDADSFPEKDALKKMVGYFEDPNVMAVVPSMRPWKPKNIVERLQGIEYTLTSLIRKVMSFVGALPLTPGAPLIRKSFIEKYGGFDVGNITEDFEFGLRIQSKRYQIEHALDTTVFTVVPNNIKDLYKQRLRWNYGTLLNMKKYSHLFGFDYGDLGVLILPTTMIFLSLIVFVYIYYLFRLVLELIEKVRLATLINYNFFDRIISIDFYDFLSAITDVKTILIFLSLGFSVLVYHIARKYAKEKMGLTYFLYIFVYGWLLNFVTISSLWHFVRKKKPSW